MVKPKTMLPTNATTTFHAFNVQVGKNKLPCKPIYKTIHTILGTSLNSTHTITPYLSEERGEMKKGRSGQAAPSYSGFLRFGYNTLTHAHNHSVVHSASYSTSIYYLILLLFISRRNWVCDIKITCGHTAFGASRTPGAGGGWPMSILCQCYSSVTTSRDQMHLYIILMGIASSYGACFLVS